MAQVHALLSWLISGYKAIGGSASYCTNHIADMCYSDPGSIPTSAPMPSVIHLFSHPLRVGMKVLEKTQNIFKQSIFSHSEYT